MAAIQNTSDLLSFLANRAIEGQKDWFGFHEQRLTAINLAHEIAKNHANTMTPDQVVEYAKELNNKIYHKIIKG